MICDRCNTSMPHGTGFAFYSSASIAGQTIGNMLLCESCTDGFINDAEFAKPPPAAKQLSTDDLMAQLLGSTSPLAAMSNAAIIQASRRLGFTPSQAKAKAHELALRWWSDPHAGALQIKNFWSASAPRQEMASQKESSGGCFVATAVYGSSLAPEVMTFRQFRDEVLLPSKLGSAFVQVYYFISPSVAKVISKYELLRAITRQFFLEPILRLIKIAALYIFTGQKAQWKKEFKKFF